MRGELWKREAEPVWIGARAGVHWAMPVPRSMGLYEWALLGMACGRGNLRHQRWGERDTQQVTRRGCEGVGFLTRTSRGEAAARGETRTRIKAGDLIMLDGRSSRRIRRSQCGARTGGASGKAPTDGGRSMAGMGGGAAGAMSSACRSTGEGSAGRGLSSPAVERNRCPAQAHGPWAQRACAA